MAVLRYVKESPRTLYGVLEYVSDNKKTSPELIFGIGVNPQRAFEEMMLVKQLHIKERQRQYKQIILSFDEEESSKLPISQLLQIGLQVGEFWGKDYQVLGAIHTDGRNTHIHYIVNSVNIHTGRKFTSSRMEMQNHKLESNKILEARGLKPIANMYVNPDNEG